jgi:hypothetical protein
VGGDAILNGLTGSVEVSFVGGDLRHNGADKLDIGHVGGDLTVANVGSNLVVRKVGGDFTCDATGSISAEMVGGDSNLRLTGGARLRTGGDIRLSINAQSQDEVVVKAGGDIDLFIAPDMNAQLDLTSGGRDIVVLMNGNRDAYEQENKILTLGAGERSIRVKAGGDIRVTDEPMEMRNLEDEFVHMEYEFHAGHANGPVQDPQYWVDFDARIHERTTEASRRAEDRVKAAMERVERENRRREHHFGKMWGKRFGIFSFGTEMPEMPEVPGHPEPPSHPEPTSGVEAQVPVAETPEVSYEYDAPSGVTNEERMLVLKMVQEHKITVEEAEQLLAELDGKFD